MKLDAVEMLTIFFNKYFKGGGLEMIGGFVGFANLPNQVHRKSVKKGFEFTMMAVGER